MVVAYTAAMTSYFRDPLTSLRMFMFFNLRRKVEQGFEVRL